MCKLGKFLLYLVMQISAEYLLWSHGITCSPMKRNKDLLKTALPNVCVLSECEGWCHTMHPQHRVCNSILI